MSSFEQAPLLMRQARKALNHKNYEEGLRLYDEVLAIPEMQHDLDLRLRLGWCAEQIKRYDRALSVYQEVYDIYVKDGEVGAAASLLVLIEKLEAEMHGDHQPELEDALSAEDDVEAFDDVALVELLCANSAIRQLNAGDVLCSSGETSHCLWFLHRGKLIVHMPDYEEKDEIEAIEHGLVLVGEVGAFTRQRRNATLIAQSDVELFEISTDDIQRLCDEDVGVRKGMDRLLRERWVKPLLSNHRVFERVNEIDRKYMAAAFEACNLEAGETLIQHGEDHDGVYLLLSGCLFFMHGDDGSSEEGSSESIDMTTSIFPGDMVHLGGLLHGYQPDYRVVAATPVKLLHFTRAAFEPFSARRPWIIPAILKYGRRPPHLQVMQPEDNYRWDTDRVIILPKKLTNVLGDDKKIGKG